MHRARPASRDQDKAPRIVAALGADFLYGLEQLLLDQRQDARGRLIE